MKLVLSMQVLDYRELVKHADKCGIKPSEYAIDAILCAIRAGKELDAYRAHRDLIDPDHNADGSCKRCASVAHL